MTGAGTSTPAGADDDGEGLDDAEAMLARWRGPARPRRYRQGARWGGEPGPARKVLSVRLAEDEIADLAAAAARAGLTTSGYVAKASLAAARDQPPPADYNAVLALVRSTREALGIGGNLNQAVRALHATGQAPAYLERLAVLCLDAVHRMEDRHRTVVDSFAGRTTRRRRPRALAPPPRPADPAAALAGELPTDDGEGLAPAGEDAGDVAAAPRSPAPAPAGPARSVVPGSVVGRLLQRRAAGED